MSKSTTIVWFRNDLRIDDNPALLEAALKGEVVPVYIWNPSDEGEWPLGAASKWWLHHSLQQLEKELGERSLSLTIRSGKAEDELRQLAKETGAARVFWNRRYEPAALSLDAAVRESLHEQGLDTQTFNASLLYEPWTIANKQGKPFQVFTPFWKTCGISPPQKPLPRVSKVFPQATKPRSVGIDALGLLPKIHWDSGLAKAWTPGSAAAKAQLKRFIEGKLGDYQTARDFPDEEGVSFLSPYLHFGEIGPRTVWHAIAAVGADAEPYLRQLGWREFAHHLLYHFPFTPEQPLRRSFEHFPWRNDPIRLKAWQRGMTGYPIVDAGMRQLWKTGWMHNRVRMIVGSFLVKDLLISWREGALWFWDTLVDADLANNTLGWQWVGGCGADAAPYFRVFNPVLQGEKFDAEGSYVRRWVPELAHLPDKWIHRPWEAPQEVLWGANVVLGRDYPQPIVDHAVARLEALEAFKSVD